MSGLPSHSWISPSARRVGLFQQPAGRRDLQARAAVADLARRVLGAEHDGGAHHRGVRHRPARPTRTNRMSSVGTGNNDAVPGKADANRRDRGTAAEVFQPTTKSVSGSSPFVVEAVARALDDRIDDQHEVEGDRRSRKTTMAGQEMPRVMRLALAAGAGFLPAGGGDAADVAVGRGDEVVTASASREVGGQRLPPHREMIPSAVSLRLSP